MTQPGQSDQPYDVDVILATDLRLPGGTTASMAEEVRAQSDAGMSTALMHLVGSVTNYALGWSSHIRRVVGLPNVRLATPHSRIHAKLLILRHPTVMFSTRSKMENITADKVVVIVNHAAIDSGGKQHYDIPATNEKVRELFGQEPIWAPIGPVVRGTMLQQTRDVPFREDDWVNIFSLPVDHAPRTGFLGQKPIIGRHSRPQPGKWPATGKNILAAYPDSEHTEVRVLGGAEVADKLLGYVPDNWHVIPFGGEDPAVFLEGLDFWVYMHHPDLKEAFGRAAMEALAAGCVAILPPYMKELFGDAALYAKPRQVQGLIEEYYADEQKFLAQSRRAQEFARSFSPQMHVRRLAELGVQPSAPAALDTSTHDDAEAPAPESTLLLATGEMTEARLADLARAAQTDPGLHLAVVADAPPASLPADQTTFIPSVARLNMQQTDWDGYLGHRLQRLVENLHPDAVIFDGVLPPLSVTDVLDQRPVEKTWLQRSAISDTDDSILQGATVAAEKHFQTLITLDLEPAATVEAAEAAEAGAA